METPGIGREERLQRLLDASAALVEELDLEPLLRRVAEVGMDLANARYGALGVIGPDRMLERFIHVGISDEVAERIGRYPEGLGVLGALIDEPHPIRIPDLARDPRSAGFPPFHPPMTTFLGVPIRVRDEVYGNLYLAERRQGEFTAEDEELLTVLAGTAGIAIENARLYEEAQRRQRWSAAAAEVSSALVSDQPDTALALIADRVTRLADADVVCLLLPTGEHSFLVEVARGQLGSFFEGAHLVRVGSLAQHAFGSGQPIDADEPTPDGFLNGGGLAIEEDGSPVLFGPTMAIPLVATGAPSGVLVAARRGGRQRFSRADLEMAADFASQATVALELARGRADRVRLTLLEDRSRIARDLHDHVIQRLFAAGLGLQVTDGAAQTPEVHEGIADAIGALDAAITEIRTAIFAMTADSSTQRGLRHRVIDVIGESAPALSFSPRLSFGGAVDLLVPEGIADDITAVVREGLANVARHARASTTTVSIIAADGGVVVEIVDDGIGIGTGAILEGGTKNLMDRAVSWGGECAISGVKPTGTRLSWRVPLPKQGERE